MVKILPVDFKQPDVTDKAIDTIRSTLNSGGVIAFPTDTFYGLGADPFNPNALSKIFQIKQRPDDKPLLVLIHSKDQLGDLAEHISPMAKTLMEHFWPGPLTLLFKSIPDLPKELTAGTGKIGIRLSAHTFTTQLLEALKNPITAPSANISGTGELDTAQKVESILGNKLDLIVNGGPTPGGKTSTVLDTTTIPPTLIREGAISRNELESVVPIK